MYESEFVMNVTRMHHSNDRKRERDYSIFNGVVPLESKLYHFLSGRPKGSTHLSVCYSMQCWCTGMARQAEEMVMKEFTWVVKMKWRKQCIQYMQNMFRVPQIDTCYVHVPMRYLDIWNKESSRTFLLSNKQLYTVWCLVEVTLTCWCVFANNSEIIMPTRMKLDQNLEHLAP